MSKRIDRFFMPVLVAALAVGGLLLGNFYVTSSAQSPAVATGTSRSAAIVATTMEVLRETSEVRELAILRPVKSGAQSRAEIERMLVKKLDEQTTEDEMHATEVSLRKFGLVPEGFSYRPFIIKLLSEQVAGYYDAKAREFYLADWIELEGQKPVMAHELTHALQDQHFNLRRFEKGLDGESDAELAAHALIEGDATLAMTLYMIKNPLVALAFTRSLTGLSASSKEFNDAPRALRETLIFPYSQGAEWATAVYKRGGWKTVSGAYAKLPLSTEQILHPEKYFSYEVPLRVTLTDMTNWLNENRRRPTESNHAVNGQQQTADRKSSEKSAQPHKNTRAKKTIDKREAPAVVLDTRRSVSKWRRIDYDVNGEWSYYLILDEFLKEPATSKKAVAGWAGDRYAIYENSGMNQVLVTHVSEWETAKDAEEFFSAYVKRTVLRYPGATVIPDQSGNEPIRRWATNEGGVVVELRGSRVLVVEGIPINVDFNLVMDRL